MSGVVWAVNLSADGRFVVAGYGDGTIRWHRFRDGREVLALFPPRRPPAPALYVLAVGITHYRDHQLEAGVRYAAADAKTMGRLTGRAMIAATADGKMAIEGEGGHGAFTYALLQGLRSEVDRNHNDGVEVCELADYVEEALPRITRKWGYEQFPFSSTEGSSGTLEVIRSPPKGWRRL